MDLIMDTGKPKLLTVCLVGSLGVLIGVLTDDLGVLIYVLGDYFWPWFYWGFAILIVSGAVLLLSCANEVRKANALCFDNTKIQQLKPPLSHECEPEEPKISDLESEHEFRNDHATNIYKMRTFFKISNIEHGSENQTFTVIGGPGTGKTYLCNQFESEVREKQPDIHIVWVETFREKGLLKFLEGFNKHSCELGGCHVDPLVHHLKLFVRNLKKSKQRYLLFVPIFSETTTTFFIELSKKLSKYSCKKNVWMVQILNSPKVYKKKAKEIAIVNKLTKEGSEMLAKGVNNNFSDKTIRNLRKVADSNPMLLKLAASIINMQSPIFGISCDTQFHQLESFMVKDNSSHSGRHPSSHAILKYAWNYLSCKHPHGYFAQQILALSVYMKTWIPISVLHVIKFPSSTYKASNIADGKPVSAVTCNLLQNLGLLLPHSTTDHVNVSYLMKDYVYNQILKEKIPNRIIELILLNMRFTEGFISSFAGPFDLVKDIVSSPINDVFKDHVMSILRKPFNRIYLSQSKGVATEVMLKELQRLVNENEIFSAEERIEIITIIHENQFYAGDFQNALDNLHQDWINSQELFKPGSKTYLRITQLICFLLESIKSEDADFYFNKILESESLGVVDDEVLSAQKTYYESWNENCGTSRSSRAETQAVSLLSGASKHQESASQPKSGAEYFCNPTAPKMDDGNEDKQNLENSSKIGKLKSTVRERLSDLVENTTLSSELCCSLRENDLVTHSEFEKLMTFLSAGLHINGAAYLYNSIVPRIHHCMEAKFMKSLREGKNDVVIGILDQFTSGEEGGSEQGLVSPLQLEKAEVDFLRAFDNEMFSQKGKLEGLALEDEERANEVLRGSVRGGGSAWRLLEAQGVVETAKQDEFIRQVRSVVKCLEEGTLWWNPNPVPLPPNFIPRKLQRLAASGEKGKTLSLSELSKSGEPFLWLVDAPGSGKSTVTTKLEEEWRRSTPSPRVIVRINLNLVQQQLQQEKMEDDFNLVAFLKRFVPFLPLNLLSRLPGGSVKVVVLLDALDEVLPQHKHTMLRLLHKLLLSPHEPKERDFTSVVLRRPDLRESLRLEKLFLTTRPHLHSLVETEFGVTAHTLLPLDIKEQVEFLSKEVSRVFEFTEDEAETKLNSLPPSAQSLMENPLAIFHFAQVTKHSGVGGKWGDLDLFSFYESLLMEKHTIRVVEEQKPTHSSAQRRLKNLFEENLPFYYAIALNQLKPNEANTWAKFFRLPDSPKREELLSFGLITKNSSDQLQFLNRSYAEFLYARVLTAPSSPTPLRDALFREIYSEDPSLKNVEEFVLFALKKRRAEFPTERLLPLSPYWLPGFDFFQRHGDPGLGVTLRQFLGGRLFPLLGQELLPPTTSIDLNQHKIIDDLTSVAAEDEGVALREWLSTQDPRWVRSRLFLLPADTDPTHQWTGCQCKLAENLLREHPQFASRCLTFEEIQCALSTASTAAV